MITVPHYGLHFASGVGFLIQRTRPQSLYKGLESPFQVHGKPKCPHQVDLDEASENHREVLKDPLLAWMADPKGVALLYDADAEYVERAMQLYAPTEHSLAMGWGNRTWRRHMYSTNLSPWVLVDVNSREMPIVWSTKNGAPRPLLCLAREIIPGTVVQSAYPTLPEPNQLRALGAWAVKERLKK